MSVGGRAAVRGRKQRRAGQEVWQQGEQVGMQGGGGRTAIGQQAEDKSTARR